MDRGRGAVAAGPGARGGQLPPASGTYLAIALRAQGREDEAYETLDYANSGFYEEAIDLLVRLEERGSEYPMVYYYLGYYWAQTGDGDRSSRYYRAASQLPPDYCFPFRAESVDVLTHAARANPRDASAGRAPSSSTS